MPWRGWASGRTGDETNARRRVLTCGIDDLGRDDVEEEEGACRRHRTEHGDEWTETSFGITDEDVMASTVRVKETKDIQAVQDDGAMGVVRP